MITSTAIGTGGLGRFGNQMFTIAGVIGIAIKSGQPFGFPKWKNYDNALFGGEVTDFEQFFENPLPQSNGAAFNEYGYFWGYRDVYLPTGNWSINAHLQSPKFFEHCINEVRHYFRMKDELGEAQGVEKFGGVAIHYRAGDYIDDPRAYHPRCSLEYYEQAIKLFDDELPFMVYSDDPDYFIKKVKGSFWQKFPKKRFYGFAEDYYLKDFKSMKRASHFIIANSSFSAMAAHLGEHPEKKVVAPKLWFGEQANGLPSEDIYDKNWIVI